MLRCIVVHRMPQSSLRQCLAAKHNDGHPNRAQTFSDDGALCTSVAGALYPATTGLTGQGFFNSTCASCTEWLLCNHSYSFLSSDNPPGSSLHWASQQKQPSMANWKSQPLMAHWYKSRVIHWSQWIVYTSVTRWYTLDQGQIAGQSLPAHLLLTVHKCAPLPVC